MKRAYILILTLIAGWQYAASAGDGSRFEKFVDACVSLRDGIEAKDRYAVMDARAAFVEAGATLICDFEVLEGSPAKSDFLFNEKYCDYVLSKDFDLVRLSECEVMHNHPEESEIDFFDSLYFLLTPDRSNKEAEVRYLEMSIPESHTVRISIGGGPFSDVAVIMADKGKLSVCAQTDDTLVPFKSVRKGKVYRIASPMVPPRCNVFTISNESKNGRKSLVLALKKFTE